ncbi:MAG TPA: T9SS type A sorting domain-containing protein, partial [Bacteroidales bacterium]|nr:T9SS type A sorting domain-containing protein [Bacteroidales bacterium]
GEDTDAPFAYEWTPATEGPAVIRAIAVDDRGLTAKDSKRTTVTSDCLNMIKPDDNSQFNSGDNIVLKALGSSCAGEISNVSFYINNSTVLEDLTASPGDGSYGVSFQGAEDGVYNAYAIATTDLGFLMTDTIHFVIGDTTNTDGIMNHNIRGALVYPNPSGEGFHFKINLRVSSNVVVRIYNVYGQVVHAMEVPAATGADNEVYWDAKDQKAGVYLYRIDAGNETRNGMIVIN